MSRRTRRQRTPNLPPEAFEAPIFTPQASTPRTMNAENSNAAASANSRRHVTISIADLRAEYGIVIRDLRFTFAIFIVLVLIMVALSFVVG
ncbi:MAG: hypothetical protein RMM31_10210 [Anaerolineae bacterium]|nr:hypothetical protein [Thermoflexales bacterium]MDW8396600.1 hypothetical protein [Anaerolineae bacterium]